MGNTDVNCSGGNKIGPDVCGPVDGILNCQPFEGVAPFSHSDGRSFPKRTRRKITSVNYNRAAVTDNALQGHIFLKFKPPAVWTCNSVRVIDGEHINAGRSDYEHTCVLRIIDRRIEFFEVCDIDGLEFKCPDVNSCRAVAVCVCIHENAFTLLEGKRNPFHESITKAIGSSPLMDSPH